jgi:hypothetical protein
MSPQAEISAPPPPGKRFVTTCLAKGGVGKTTAMFHLLRWYHGCSDGALRVSAFDPDGRNKSLFYLTSGKDEYQSPYPATVVKPMQQEGMFCVTTCLRHDIADVSALDGVGSAHKEIIDDKWFDYLDVPAICAKYNARVTLILIIDNTSLVYRECLETIAKFAATPNVDFVVLHVRRDELDVIDDPVNQQTFNDFVEGVNGRGGVKNLIADWKTRFAWATVPHISTKVSNRLYAAKGTLCDLFNNRFIDSEEHQALMKRLWDGYCAAFRDTSHLLLPVKQTSEVSR